MNRKSTSHKIERSPADIARLKQTRADFQRDRPSLQDLSASGEYAGPFAQGDVLTMLALAAQIKSLRQARQLSLTDVAKLSGIDKAQLSRIENGLNANPTLATLETIVRSLGAKLRFVIDDPLASSATS
jgi:DNA-binding Xre family transcriptional regulator